MKKLVLNLTGEQFARFDLLAKLLRTEPEQLVPALALGDPDACMGEFGEWEQGAHSAVAFYAEKRKASDKPRGKRLEDTAPDRLLRLARGAKEVRHV